MEQILIQVDKSDNVLGTIEKMQAHRQGILHRAFSVFLFTPDGKWILQQRSLSKYHSAGLWSNTCCGHPLAGEETPVAAQRRLRFEMGIGCPLEEIFSFTYRAELENGLVEHEYDHIFAGRCATVPYPHPAEVMSWKFVETTELLKDIDIHPGSYTAWFRQLIHKVIAHQTNKS